MDSVMLAKATQERAALKKQAETNGNSSTMPQKTFARKVIPPPPPPVKNCAPPPPPQQRATVKLPKKATLVHPDKVKTVQTQAHQMTEAQAMMTKTLQLLGVKDQVRMRDFPEYIAGRFAELIAQVNELTEQLEQPTSNPDSIVMVSETEGDFVFNPDIVDETEEW